MRHYNKWLIGILAGVVCSACSNDTLAPEGNGFQGTTEDGVYFSLDIQLPDGKSTRSYTDGDNSSNNGVEVGTDKENNIAQVLLVLADKDNKYIASSLVMQDNLTFVTAGDKKAYQALAKFNKTAINTYYGSEESLNDPIVRVFVYANPKTSLLEKFRGVEPGNTDWVNFKISLTDSEVSFTNSPIWATNIGEGSFIMTNVEMAERELPLTLDKWAPYTTKSHPFDLSGINNPGLADQIDNLNNHRGTVKVHRMAARFDFKDGSPADTEANTYSVLHEAAGENSNADRGPAVVNVRLNKMVLVNASRDMYYLERTSENGLPTGANFGILNPELPWYVNANGVRPADRKPGNYVIGCNYDVFNTTASGLLGTNDYTKYFYSPFFNNGKESDPNNPNESGVNPDNANGEIRWKDFTSYIPDVLKGQTGTSGGDYHIWAYAAENTIPAPVENQVNGYSTGVVFKGKLIGTEASKNHGYGNMTLYEVLNHTGDFATENDGVDPIIYQFNGALYVSWDDIRDQAIKDSYNENTKQWDRLTPLYQAVFGNGGAGVNGDELEVDKNSPNFLWEAWDKVGRPNNSEQLAAFRKAATGKAIALYQPSLDDKDGWGYYCYYYYWNRHNDNGNNGVMGDMEFAVVRNNVYKLAVTKLSQLGHPRIPENDPDNPTPDTPDEAEDLYITVTAEVLPWVVRINDIEF